MTRKRNTAKPPARCPNCNSSRTYVVRCFSTDDEKIFGGNDKMLEKMFKEYMKMFKDKGDV